jgi:hypothetical protein
MARSKKGRLTGGARKEINERRAADAISGKADDVAFARVTKILGANHVRVALPASHGTVEVNARIPNIFARRGATPITTRDVVTIFVGKDFDVNGNDFSTAHFDITSILTNKQSYELYKEGTLPNWMIHEESTAVAETREDGGFEFDYAEVKEEDESEGKEKGKDKDGKARKSNDDEINIDDI